MRKLKVTWMNSLLTSLVLVTGAEALAQMGEAPPVVTIGEISYGGNGCPQFSVSKTMSNDRKAFTLLFDQFIAEVGPNVSRVNNRKSCQLTVPLRFPAGWTFAIASFDYRGYIDIDAGVAAEQQSTYYFMGERTQGRSRSTMFGPQSQDYTFHDDIAMSAMVFAPCGVERPLNIKAEVRLMTRDPYATGIITLDSFDGKIAHTYGMVWKRCF